MINEIQAAIWLLFGCLIILIHEFGHYLAARKQGIYKGWGLFPNPHIKLTQPYANRWSYLSGLAASLFLFPLLLWIFGAEWLWLFFFFCFLISPFDFIVVIWFQTLKERRKKRK